jgi:hypothetical protein
LNTAEVIGITSVTGDRLRQPARGALALEISNRLLVSQSADGTLPMSDSISLSQLESHLWEAANILRGPVDAADFKTYVFPLLFFKRISDVYDEEYAAALAESGGDEEYAQFPQNYRFQIPKECHWNDVRVVATNDDEKIQRHEDFYSRRFTLLESRKEPPESAKRNKTRGEISRKYGVNCFRSGRRSAFRSE